MSALNNDLTVIITNQHALRRCLEDTKAKEAVVAEDLDEKVQVDVAMDAMVDEIHLVVERTIAIAQTLLLKQCCSHHMV